LLRLNYQYMYRKLSIVRDQTSPVRLDEEFGMPGQKTAKKNPPSLYVSDELKYQLAVNSEKCIRCKLCQKECGFLRKYGKPKDIADSYDPSDKIYQVMPFECSLCQLCAAVCPVKINPSLMFLEMRRETAGRGNGDYPEHSVILGYEKRGTSKRYSYYALPGGCDTVFFPGCTLSGTRPDKVMQLYEYLKKTVPDLGIVLDCCTKPSHDLGRRHYFSPMFQEMKDYLLQNGVRKVIVACPNCFKIFNTYGGGISALTAYEYLSENGLPDTGQAGGTVTVTVHDPCALRFEEKIHSAVRDLVNRKGLTIEEMPHSRKKTLCCGEGGSAGFLSPELAKKWGMLRKKESDGKRIITYCAGCANYLGKLTPTSHLLDLLFEPEATMAGRVKVSGAPFTYLNRLKLKKQFKNKMDAVVTRERIFSAEKVKR
jgi:Fe-S oxidoreductase